MTGAAARGAALRADDVLAVSAPPGAVVVDAIPPESGDQLQSAYESSFSEAIAAGGSIYSPMPPLLAASHERRVALLESLPLGDLRDKVCVDYGVGSWGFGAIFPALQRCGFAIGMDISRAALEASARVSAEREWPYGRRYVYVTSRGDELRLRDASVDVFFAGESVEHVENLELFLEEVHRVLRPGGLFVLTTPNADAYLYRARGERYCASVEHLSLLGWAELQRYLAPRFETVVARGFNASVHEDWDDRIRDPAFIKSWTEQLSDRADLATSIVLLARRRDDHRPARIEQRVYHHESREIAWAGPWQAVPLHRSMTGRMATGGDRSAMTLDFDGTDLLVFLWSHPWSGQAFVEVDGVCEAPVELYGCQAGFRRVHVGGLAPGRHRLRLRGSRLRDPRSRADQAIFYEAIGYSRLDEEGDAMTSTVREAPADVATTPSRFGIVYTAPGGMDVAARVVLYSLVLGLRPRRCLGIGTREGGAALVVAAALDDLGAGRLVCVDPRPAVPPERWAQIAHRATLVPAAPPAALSEARDAAGGRFDFAFLDADRGYAAVARDVEAVLGVLEPSAYLLVHGASDAEVKRAVDDVLCRSVDRLLDCGMLAGEQATAERVTNGHDLPRGGLRLLRHHRPA
jgi:SAM-dependent methyltransferase/predicted O-methyltransferase YrrM